MQVQASGTTKRYYGVIFIIISAFFFALMNMFVKLAGELPTMQKAFFRNLVAAGVAFVLLLRKPSQFRTLKGNLYPLIMRSVAGVVGIILNFAAIDSMDIADASILNKLSPFFSMIFSIFLLREKPNRYEWLAVAVAFTGALFVVKPTFSPDVIPAVGGVMGGMSAGLAYTFVRKAGAGGASRNLIVFFFSAFSCLVLLPFLIAEFTPMTTAQTLFLLGAGASAAGGQIFITRAYTYAPAKEISVFDYTIVIFAAILGAIFLSEFPDALSYVGYVIVICGAAINWIHNMAVSRRSGPAVCKEPKDADKMGGDVPDRADDDPHKADTGGGGSDG